MVMSGESKNTSILGSVLFAGLLAKILWEIASGGSAMNYLHFGDVGVPMVTSHLGGLVGGSVVFGVLRLGRKLRV